VHAAGWDDGSDGMTTATCSPSWAVLAIAMIYALAVVAVAKIYPGPLAALV